jgi:1-acyl-sn-glycerol-3-phosphate acyltransferase
VIWALRRLVIAPAMVALAVGLWATLPLWLIAAAALSPLLPGRWRALRLLWLFVIYVSAESVLLVVLFGLWLASGFGRRVRTPYFEGIHYDLVQGLMWVLFTEARRVLALRIETEGGSSDPAEPGRTTGASGAARPRARRTLYPGKPLIVACRHAGPGDSFTLIHALMHWYDREPRVVLKDTLAWDPVVDVVLSRIPARFISASPGKGQDFESQIAELARGLDANDAFVIFPEGGNFTPERRRRGIERLRRLGLERMADRAEQMTHVLAPRPGGFLAALDAAPEADVVMVAHTGLDHMLTAGDVWRELPMDKVIVMRWWPVAREDIPADREAQIEWLFGWWERIDAWIAENRPRDLSRARPRRDAVVS